MLHTDLLVNKKLSLSHPLHANLTFLKQLGLYLPFKHYLADFQSFILDYVITKVKIRYAERLKQKISLSF